MSESPSANRAARRAEVRTKQRAQKKATAASARDRGQPGESPLAVYAPIVPAISPEHVCRDLFVRAYAFPKKWRATRTRRRSQRALPTLDGLVILLDTETVDHNLTYGVFEVWERRKLRMRAVLYHDDLPTNDPAGFDRLRAICLQLGIKLTSRNAFFVRWLWRVRNHGGIVTGFNIAYDLSRLADGYVRAVKTSRLGSRFCNGFGFTKHFLAEGKLQEPIFCRIKRDDRHHVRYDMKAAAVLELANWSFSHTDRNHTLAGACEAFGVAFGDRPGGHSGEITRANVEGCLHDVAKTSALLWAVDKEHSRHPIALHPVRAQSGASIAKAYLAAQGVQPRLDVQPDFPLEYLGYAAQSYFGGWVEAGIVKLPFPCIYIDFLSQYPTIFSLLGLWFSHVIPKRLIVEEVPQCEVEALLEGIRTDPSRLFNRATWPDLAFFAQVLPNGASLPARVEIPTPERIGVRNITVGPIFSDEPLWYAGPDLAEAALRGGTPTIARAWRLRPESDELLEGLAPIAIRGEDIVDPRTEDFFTRLIEMRKRKSGDRLDDERRSTGYKVIANSGAYGVFAETNPVDVDPESEHDPQPVIVHGDTLFATTVDRPERPGRYNFFPIASLVTAGARLMLALGHHEVERRGGEVAYCDTDSLVVVATKDGGFFPCEGGSWQQQDRTRGVRALSWSEVEAVRQRFASINPYEPEKLPGSILKLEDENLDPATGEQRELWCYAVSEKSYALFNRDDQGLPFVRKHSAHVLGQYRSPIAGDRHGWIVQAWEREIRKALGMNVEPFAWESLPAIAQLTLTTWSVFKPYRESGTASPFDFLAIATPTRSLHDFAKGYEACCAEPRPACPLFDDPQRWEDQPWRCLKCGKEIPVKRFRIYGSVLRGTLESFELKRLLPDGTPLNRHSCGFTIPRPVHVASKTYIGKEVIVDPTDTDEMLTAEMLSETETLIYACPQEDLRALLDRVKQRGIKKMAREGRLSARHLNEAVNAKSQLRSGTIAKVRDLLQRLKDYPEPISRT